MEENMYCYKYPHPAVTTDCVIFGFDGEKLKVLLIQRGIEPYKGKWALPGGFLKPDESAETGHYANCEKKPVLQMPTSSSFTLILSPTEIHVNELLQLPISHW